VEKKQIKDLEIRGKFFIRFFPEKSKPDNVFFSTRFSTIPTKNPALTFNHLDCKSPFQQAIINTKVYLKLKKEKIFMVGWDGGEVLVEKGIFVVERERVMLHTGIIR
jgi:hypothetical protein